ncbi:unnamed protein product [Schistosoma margrebowiei]|uniref:Uncharacterized protein n=1 Tax=Schistosoma margrebowiei TaxID=48269 RepID=A0A183LYA9_9TREM|nr:unnamed protein product [Schistosoma margrebowiei]
MVVGGSQCDTLNLGFVLVDTHQQGVSVILMELKLPDRFGFESLSSNSAHFLPAQLNGAAAAAAAAAAASYTLTATSPITARQPSAYAYLPGYYLSPGECPLSQPLSVFLPPTAILPPYANVISMT